MHENRDFRDLDSELTNVRPVDQYVAIELPHPIIEMYSITSTVNLEVHRVTPTHCVTRYATCRSADNVVRSPAQVAAVVRPDQPLAGGALAVGLAKRFV